MRKHLDTGKPGRASWQAATAVAGLAMALSCLPGVAVAGQALATCVPTAGGGGGGVPAAIVTTDGLPGHAEPAIAVSARDPMNLLGAAQFVLPAAAPRAALRHWPGAFYSADGGRTWHDNGPLDLPPGYSGADDVSAGFAGGTGMITAEAYRTVGGSSILVWRTEDGGRRFSPPADIFDTPASGPDTDHPSLAVLEGRIVAIAWNFGNQLLFSRSVDAGRTFTPARQISAASDVHPSLAVLAPGVPGTINVIYESSTEAVKSATVRVVTSVDGGMTFGSPVSLPAGVYAQAGPQPFESSLPAVAASSRTGQTYVALSRYQGPGSRQTLAVYRSPDGGRTWSAADVPPPPQASQADLFQPSLAVTADGTVYISYYAFDGQRVSTFLSSSADGGAAFTGHTLLGTPFDPACGLAGVWKTSPWLGDYQALTTSADHVYAAWTDASTGTAEIAAVGLRAGGQPRE